MFAELGINNDLKYIEMLTHFKTHQYVNIILLYILSMYAISVLSVNALYVDIYFLLTHVT